MTKFVRGAEIVILEDPRYFAIRHTLLDGSIISLVHPVTVLPHMMFGLSQLKKHLDDESGEPSTFDPQNN